MTPIFPDRSQTFGMSIPMPISFTDLTPSRFPSEVDVKQVAKLQQTLLKQARLSPGVHSSTNDDILRKITSVYDGLMDVMVAEIAQLDVTSLCISLYQRSEEYLGNINKFRHLSIPETLLAGRTDAAMARQQLWQAMSPYTTSIRWLIEICAKYCQPSENKLSSSQLGYLIELARAILTWDSVWEYIYSGTLQHEVIIGTDFSLSTRPTVRTAAAFMEHQKATIPWRVDEDRQWINDMFRIRAESSNWTAEKSLSRIERDPEWGPLSKAMQKELGYSATDMMRYSGGLLDFFEPTKYITYAPKDELGVFLSRKWKLSPERFELLLADHALSKQLMADYSIDKLRPTEYAGRDTRLIRRPVVLLEGLGSKPVCLYGIETLEISNRLFLFRFPSGRIQLQRMSNRGPVKRAIGRIQTKLGNALRDEIADHCAYANYTVVKEKKGVRSERIPQDAGFGPVDVFIVDKRFRRFVLAEAKDVTKDITVPTEVKNELLQFQEYVEKIEEQSNWFRERVEVLKSEFGIAPEEHYSVEGVIIVNYPRLWMYDHQEQLPVVADKHFYEMLQREDQFLTTPVRG